MKTKHLFALALISYLVLIAITACGGSTGGSDEAITLEQTAVALALTQTAMASPPQQPDQGSSGGTQSTPTPIPQQPQATQAPAAQATPIDMLTYVKDLSLDDTNGPPVLEPGQAFKKGWIVKNTGQTTWDTSYSFAFKASMPEGVSMDGVPVALTRDVPPGDTYEVYVDLVAPTTPSRYKAWWQIRNGNGTAFGQTPYLYIEIPGAATATPDPTQTPVPGIQFATVSNRTTIDYGEGVEFVWDVENVTAVYFGVKGQELDGVGGHDQRGPFYPRDDTVYVLEVHRDDETIETRAITIHVKEPESGAPTITEFNISPSKVKAGQPVDISWEIEGSVQEVKLTREGTMLWDQAPLSGIMQDKPLSTVTYRLEAIGASATDRRQWEIEVIGSPNNVELSDGTQCAFAGTGATLAFGEKRLNYTCGNQGQDQIGLLGDFELSGLTWTAEKAIIGRDDDGFFVKESEILTIRSVW